MQETNGLSMQAYCQLSLCGRQSSLVRGQSYLAVVSIHWTKTEGVQGQLSKLKVKNIVFLTFFS